MRGMAGCDNAGISCSLLRSLQHPSSALVVSNTYVRLLGFRCVFKTSIQNIQSIPLFLSTELPKGDDKREAKDLGMLRGAGLERDGVPACCGPSRGTARCQSCWFSHSGAWRAAAPSGVCSASAGACAPHPLCCQRRGKEAVEQLLPPQSHCQPTLP